MGRFRTVRPAIEPILFAALWLLLPSGIVAVLLTRSLWCAGASLVVLGYLTVLNGLLRGSLKAWLDAFLGACFVVLIILSFVSFGWKLGLGSIVTPMIAGAMLKPLAQLHARYVLSR